jgi:hypothetical protein
MSTKRSRGRAVPINIYFEVSTPTRRVTCNLEDYLKREPDFLQTLCECDSLECTRLHYHHHQNDFTDNSD